MPLRFCPTCGNVVRIEQGPFAMRFSCPTCPYTYNIMDKVSTRTYYNSREVADTVQRNSILEKINGMDMNCPHCATNVICPRCGYPRAYFTQLLTRSADEPITIFYICCKRECSYTWRDG